MPNTYRIFQYWSYFKLLTLVRVARVCCCSLPQGTFGENVMFNIPFTLSTLHTLLSRSVSPLDAAGELLQQPGRVEPVYVALVTCVADGVGERVIIKVSPERAIRAST